MNRNVESHFAELPGIEVERSTFDRSQEHQTTFNVGQLIPYFWDEVLPGDTFRVTTSIVARLQTLLAPIMGNLYMDTFSYFIPMRLCWNHTKEFFGENTQSPWVQQTEYTIPKIKSPVGGWSIGSLADYMGIPVNVEFRGDDDLLPSALPFRAVALCVDQWHRDQNIQQPLNIPLGDATQEGTNGDNFVTDVANGGAPFIAAKFHDMFTSLLPSPQKGISPQFNLINGNLAPVLTADKHSYNNNPVSVGYVDGTTPPSSGNYLEFYGAGTLKGVQATSNVGNNPKDVYFDNLWADLSYSVGAVTINELRLAFQLQKFYERQARSGSRYREVLLSQYGVHSPDARMMIPEYLGGHRFPINIHQITNNSESDGSNLGDLGAMSNTADVHDDFVKSFTEHGFVISFCVLRYDHSFPQGLSREWTRTKMLDYYFPVFANIGEQPVYTYEIDATKRDGENRNDVFGYNEAWCQYRFKPNRVSGLMRPNVDGSLAHWNLADNYAAAPRLSSDWLREDKTNVDRTLAVTSEVSHQVFADFYVKNLVTRAMPMYSIPGLIDHH